MATAEQGHAGTSGAKTGRNPIVASLNTSNEQTNMLVLTCLANRLASPAE